MICPVRQYADAVIAGEITAGRLVRLACERHIADLERDDVYFDEAAARATIELFRYFPHTLGRWRGQEFVCLPYQSFIVGSLFGWMSRETEQRRFRYAYVELSRKNGKALDIETPIPVPGGWTSMGSLKVNDNVFDENGEPTRVVACTEVMHDRKCYRVGFADGTSIVADGEHEWITQNVWDKKRGNNKDQLALLPATVTTKDIRKTLTRAKNGGGKREWNHRVMLAGPLQTPAADLSVHPYVLGTWLGDGSTDSAVLTCSYKDLELVENVRATGTEMHERVSTNENSGSFGYGSRDRTQAARNVSVQAKLRKLGVLGNKHIPAE